MKKTSAILSRVSALTAALVCAGPAAAADTFSENFDSQAGAHIGTNNGTGMAVTYVDYSSMTVGAVNHSVPEAPRMIAGSLPTRGVLLKADYAAAATERIANLVALDDVGGTRLPFTDNYRLKFDVYLRLSPVVSLTANGYPDLVENAGSTEQMLWGVGYNATSPMGRQFRSGRGSGMWGFLATEGGHGSGSGGDAALWSNGTLAGTRNMDLVSAPADVTNYFTPAFGAVATPVPHCPANQWVQADISVKAGRVTVEFQAVGAGRTKTKFYENVAGPVTGPVMVGYEDPFGSTSWVPDEQWMLLDNMVVEDITPPTLVVAGAAADPFAPFRGTPVTGTYNITNNRVAGDLTISAVNFTGTNAADFSLATPLPLVVGPGATLPLNIIFNPAAPNGVKSVSITIVSDDPQTPNYVLSDVRTRRSAGSFFEAHYKLDETAGNTLADASGNGAAAALTVRDPAAYGQPTLLGAADTGTGIGFTPAQSSAEGNYFTSSVVHTPTFSISLWMKPAVAGAIRTLWQRDYDSLSPYDKICCLQLLADGTLAWRVRSTTVIPGANDPPLPALADGEIWHIVLTHLDEDGFGNETATRSRLYVNGLRIAEKAGADALGFDDYPLSPVISNLHVASRTIAGHGFAGDMDDFQVYGAELTREQVWEIYKRAGRSASLDWRIVAAERTGDPVTFGVTFPSSPEGNYRLFRSPDLQTWLPAAEAVPGTADAFTTSLTDPSPPAGKQYYRVMRN